MKKIITLLLFVILFPSVVFAGEIYGTVKDGDGRAIEDVSVRVVDANDKIVSSDENSSPVTVKTDEYGSYSLYVEPEGKFKLSVYYKDQKVEPEIDVYSYKEPARYDLVLEKKKSASAAMGDSEEYSLRRE